MPIAEANPLHSILCDPEFYIGPLGLLSVVSKMCSFALQAACIQRLVCCAISAASAVCSCLISRFERRPHHRYRRCRGFVWLLHGGD